MSRIGRLPITIPSGVEVKIDGQEVSVKGPKGELSHTVPSMLTVSQEENTVTVERPDDERDTRGQHSLTRTLINNMIVGVTEGYSKKLEITGTGYRVMAKGQDLEFQLGFSHPIMVKAAEGVTYTVEGTNKVTVSGIDKQRVGEAAAKIHKLRKQDPYKGKGIKYEGEVIRRKVGKSGK